MAQQAKVLAEQAEAKIQKGVGDAEQSSEELRPQIRRMHSASGIEYFHRHL